METIEAEKTENLTDIRGAIVAPDRTVGSGVPGYYCIFGKLKNEDSEDVPRLVFIKEVEASPKALFQKLVVDEEEYRFNTLYTEPYRFSDVPDFIRDLHNCLDEENIKWIRTVPTLFFYGDDPRQGVNIIGQWAGRINIPEETTLRYQFDTINIRPEKFDDPTFYAFTALRYLLAGFKLDKGSSIEEVAKRREEVLKKDTRKKLTGADRVAADELMMICGEIERQSEFENDILW